MGMFRFSSFRCARFCQNQDFGGFRSPNLRLPGENARRRNPENPLILKILILTIGTCPRKPIKGEGICCMRFYHLSRSRPRIAAAIGRAAIATAALIANGATAPKASNAAPLALEPMNTPSEYMA